MSSVVNVAVEAGTTAAPAENNAEKIFDCEDVSFDQWLKLQIWKSHDEDGSQFINITSKETSPDDLSLSCTRADIVKTPRSEGKLEGTTLIGLATAKKCVEKKKGEHKYRGCMSLDPNRVYLDSTATHHYMFVK